MVVDDNETNRQILSRQLQSWGLDVALFPGGHEALASLRDGESFDLAILDMQMPGMDGLTLAHEIQNSPLEHPFPLVMLTSIGQHLDRDQSAGLSACLAKPVKPSLLYDVLIDLFFEEEQAAPRGAEPGSGPSAEGPLARDFPLRILVAEDNAVNQKVALRMLDRLGYRADVAANGLEVLEALERQDYDLILMDVQMPDMDGLEATRQIRARWKTTPPVEIIAMTAYAYQADLERCLAAGMDGYVSKPIRIEALMDVLRRSPSAQENGAAKHEEPHAAGGVAGITSVVDQTRMQDLLDSLGVESLADVIDSYLEDSPGLIDEMQASFARSDWDDLQRVAHSLKSSSGIFGAQEMVALCRALEISAREQALTAPGPFGSIREAFEKVRVVLDLYRTNQPPLIQGEM
jgi:CheY-like chemotaxis protein